MVQDSSERQERVGVPPGSEISATTMGICVELKVLYTSLNAFWIYFNALEAEYQ